MESHLGDLPIPNGDHVAEEPGKYRDISSICGLGENTAGKYRKRAGKVYRDKFAVGQPLLKNSCRDNRLRRHSRLARSAARKARLKKKGSIFLLLV